MKKLYWITTDDHDEDWFVVSTSSEEAARFHVESEGYDEGDAKSEFICDVPGKLLVSERATGISWWPSNDMIKSLGGVFIKEGDARVVRFGDKTYSEGLLGSIAEAARKIKNAKEIVY